MKLKPDIRKDQILKAAVDLSDQMGYESIRRDDVARVAGCSTGLVNRYYATMTQLKRAVIREAIRTERLNIIAQAIVARDPQAQKAPAELIERALEHFLA